jgi:host factor-I protein
VNRKLIRTTLAEVKEREFHAQQTRRPEPPQREREHDRDRERGQDRDRDRDRDRGDRGERNDRGDRGDRGERNDRGDRDRAPSRGPSQPAASKKKIPPEQTNAESFYYKKQMDAHTPMVLVLQDNEELHGVIEWYDKNSIKLHRQKGPNLLVLKHNIKYLYKDEDAKEQKGGRARAEQNGQHEDDEDADE